jgi:hypothetical protein
MDRKSFTVGILSITALILVIANLVPMPQPAIAAETVKDRDYQVVTARVQTGGEGLYIMDNKTGQVAVFTWDTGARQVRVRGVRNITDAFAGR